MKSQKGIIHVLLVIALLIVGLGALGYVIYKNQFGAKTIGPDVLSPTPGINTTPVPDFINDWEIYSNSAYSFKHPKDLASDTNAGGANAESTRFRYMGEKQKTSGRTQTELFDGYMFIVTKIDSSGQKSAKQAAEEAYKSTKQNCGNYDNSSISEISVITINGQIAYQYEVSNCYTDYKNTFIANGDSVYNITQSYTGEEPEYFEYKKITDQILSTFEFVDSQEEELVSCKTDKECESYGVCLEMYPPQCYTKKCIDGYCRYK